MESEELLMTSGDGRIFTILRELELNKMSSYQLVQMGYSERLIDILVRIRRYVLNADTMRRQQKK